jgi:uncharacterized protein (DUF2342 family)
LWRIRRSWRRARLPRSPSSLVRRIAETIGGQGGSAASPGGDLEAIAADSQRRVLAYTRLVPMSELPGPEMVSRQQWIEANLHSMRPVLDRVGARVGGGMGLLGRPTRALTRALFSAQVGGLTGFLAQRVLGQYDMPLLDSAGAPTLARPLRASTSTASSCCTG